MFFFQQKTAYAICSTDQSSDVCSSDLNDRPSSPLFLNPPFPPPPPPPPNTHTHTLTSPDRFAVLAVPTSGERLSAVASTQTHSSPANTHVRRHARTHNTPFYPDAHKVLHGHYRVFTAFWAVFGRRSLEPHRHADIKVAAWFLFKGSRACDGLGSTF